MSLLFGVVKFDLPHSMDAASQTMKMSVTPTHISKGYFFHNLSKIPCKMEKGKRLTKFLKLLNNKKKVVTDWSNKSKGLLKEFQNTSRTQVHASKTFCFKILIFALQMHLSMPQITHILPGKLYFIFRECPEFSQTKLTIHVHV